MTTFSVEYIDAALSVIKKAEEELQSCFDIIDKGALTRLRDSIVESNADNSIMVDERWLYIISEIINLLPNEDADKYADLQAYTRKLRGLE